MKGQVTAILTAASKKYGGTEKRMDALISSCYDTVYFKQAKRYAAIMNLYGDAKSNGVPKDIESEAQKLLGELLNADSLGLI